MPPSFRLPTTRSFGHLISTASVVEIRTASASATAAASVNTERRSPGSLGRATIETYSPAPGGDDQRRPRRPRPQLCVSATMVVPSSAPAAARAAAISLVDETAARYLTRPANRPIRSPTRFNPTCRSTGRSDAEYSERFELKADICGGCGIGRGAHRHILPSGRGDLRHALQGDASGDLDLGAAAGPSDGFGQLLIGHVVEQHNGRARFERIVQLIETLCLDLDWHGVFCLFHAADCLPYPTRQSDVIVLDQNPI